MKLCFSQHWRTDKPRFVYEVTAEVTVGSGAEAEVALPEVTYDPNKKTENDQWAAIEEKYGQSAYQNIISSYVTRLLPSDHDDYRMALVMDSTARYMKSYKGIKRKFMESRDELEEKFTDTVEDVKKKTRSELDVLRLAVEGSKPLVDFKESMPGIENGDAVKDHFEAYLEALQGRYFNVAVNEGMEIPGAGIPFLGVIISGSAVFRAARYEEAASIFQRKMKNWVEAKVTWLLKQGSTKASDLEAFKAEVAARYESYAKIDGNSSIISGADLAALNAASQPPLDVIGRVLDESDGNAAQRLEITQLLNPSAWKRTIQGASEVIMRQAVNSHSEKEFIATVKKYRPNVEINDFSEAVGEFEKMLEEISGVGVRETMDFLRSFNLGVHGDVLKYEKEVHPPALSMMVNKQMDYLLGGILIPQKETDRMLVRFMRADIDARNEILADDGSRDVLFRAIKQATEQYPELYDKSFGNIPDDVTKLIRSHKIERPSTHDQAAQMQALIILGNQAKEIVSKINRAPEHAGRDYVGEIGRTAVPPDASVVLTGLRFKAAAQGSPRFRSALDRGGFNSRDLALKGAQVLGCLVVLSNVAQSFSETHGDFVDRVLDTVERSATNQGVLVGAAVTAGAHLADRDKRFLRYPWLSQHERAATVTAYKLDNIGTRVGDNERNKFLSNNAEWRALADPAMDAAKIKEMLQNAVKEAPKGSHPVITLDDMRKVITDESILATLTVGGRSARMRYLFYQNFFGGAVKPDVNHTRELCTGSSYIAPSPVKTKK